MLRPNPRIYIIGGPGGVGKTTVAASLALRLAAEGHKTIVLTVDPARRLCQALGLEGGITAGLGQVQMPRAKGNLFASMLDTQRYFDHLVERIAKDARQREAILKNPLYEVMVNDLGGTHEYAAMERLLEFAEDPTWERIVVDTPPTDNAIELFAAPERLASFMDSSVIKWFHGTGRLPFSLFRNTTRLALRTLATLTGQEFTQKLEDFFEAIQGMPAGFKQRHEEILRLLRSPEAAFYLVSYPSEGRFLDSQEFQQALLERGIRLSGVLLNRIEASPPPLPELKHEDPRTKVLSTIGEFQHRVAHTQRQWVLRFNAVFRLTAIEILRETAPEDEEEMLWTVGESLRPLFAPLMQNTPAGIPTSDILLQ